MFTHLQQHAEGFESAKEDILDAWMGYEIVKDALYSNTLKEEFFREKFASKVYDYAISILKEENKAGDCPVIGVMLMLFKKKNIPLSDVFIICVHFKNALIHFALKNNLLTDEVLREICYLIDMNFEGVIKEYALLYYNENYKTRVKNDTGKPIFNPVSCVSNETEPLSVENQVVSAKAYLEDIEIDMEMVAELDDLEADALDAIDMNESITRDSLVESAHLFEQYSKVLNQMYDFQELSYTLNILTELLQTTDVEILSEETRSMISIYLKAIISDLQSWRMSVFMTQEAEDIHYLDKTLLSSIAQLQITLMPQVEDESEEIEFF